MTLFTKKHIFIQFFLQPKRPIKEIHYFEIKDLIIKIIKQTKSITKEDLYDLILEITDFSNFQSKTIDYLNRCVEKLVSEKIIFVDKYGALILKN